MTAKYVWIKEQRKCYPIAAMCHALKVSPSGFYDWCQRQNAPPAHAEVARHQRRSIVEKVFNESYHNYGYRKIQAELRRRGHSYALNTVYADCEHLGIQSRTRKKYRVSTTDSNHDLPMAENVLNRDFQAEKPNEKWVTDITYIRTLEGFLYVVVIIDLFSRKVIDYAMADHLKTTLVVSALQMVIDRGRKLVEGIYLHSDRGVQFSAEDFRKVLNQVEMEQSMSRQGDCWDNAPCESWFGKLKTEWIDPKGIYQTRAQAE